MDGIKSLLLGIDNKTLAIILVIVVVLAVVALIKKAIKAVVLLILVAVILGFALPSAIKLHNDYGFKYSDNKVEITVDGNVHTFDIQDIDQVDIVRVTDDQVNLTIELKDGSQVTMEMPEYASGFIQQQLVKLSGIGGTNQ